MDTPVVDLTVSSSPSAATPPLPARQRDLPLALRTAIDSADNRTLRNIVATCAERDPAARTLVTAILRQDGRVRQREEDWAICEHCNKPFDASDGADRDADAEELCEDNQLDEESFECRWHPEPAEFDDSSDTWDDWDDDCHGPMGTKENLIAYPAGFFYPCCDRPGDADPCTPRFHEPAHNKRPRR